LGGVEARDSRVAFQGVGKVSSESIKMERSDSSKQQIVLSCCEDSTDKDSFGVSSDFRARNRGLREEGTRSPSAVFSNNSRDGEFSIVSRGSGIEFSSNRETVSEMGVSESDQSSFNITSVGIEVLEGNNVEVFEGEEGFTKSETQIAGKVVFKVRANRRRGSNRGSGNGASRKVDLRGLSVSVVALSNNSSKDNSSVLVKVAVRSNDVSVNSSLNGDLSGSNDVVDNSNKSSGFSREVEVVTLEGNVSSSSNVEDELSVVVASFKSPGKGSAENGGGEIDNVRVNSRRAASNVDGRRSIFNSSNNGGESSQFVRDSSVVSLSVVKVRSNGGRSKRNSSGFNSTGDVEFVSSNTRDFSLRGVSVSRSEVGS
jgi:hypothetical protein